MRGLKSVMMQHHKSVANLSSGNRNNNEDWFNDDMIIGKQQIIKNCSNKRQQAFQGYNLRKTSSMMALPHSYDHSRQQKLVRYFYLRSQITLFCLLTLLMIKLFSFAVRQNVDIMLVG